MTTTTTDDEIVWEDDHQPIPEDEANCGCTDSAKCGCACHRHPGPTITDRGFKHMNPIPSDFGGFIRIYESSADKGPYVWVNIECPVSFNDPSGPTKEGTVHLHIENARVLAEQLMFLVNNHYQREDG